MTPVARSHAFISLFRCSLDDTLADRLVREWFTKQTKRDDYDENSGKMLLTLVSRISIIFSFAARTSSGRPATFICGSVKETNYYITMRQYVPPWSCGLRGIAIGEQLLRIDRATRTG